MIASIGLIRRLRSQELILIEFSFYLTQKLDICPGYIRG